MDISLQTRLLRVLETGQFMKIGSTTLKHVDVRVIAATNRDLEQEIVNGNFREDLFYRLSSFHIHLPPLREWREDISLFVSTSLNVAIISVSLIFLTSILSMSFPEKNLL